jgi:alpha-ketoglutarate-dependent dioxygenase FTO
MAKKKKRARLDDEEEEDDDAPIDVEPRSEALTPEDDAYAATRAAHYDGFLIDAPDQVFPAAFHDRVALALRRMLKSGEFTHDVLSAGNKVSTTFVRRTLLGDEGTTYLYQKLRLFSTPWEDKWTEGDSPHRVVRELNEKLIERTKRVLKETRHSESKCEYNITLINYMETAKQSEVALKEEAIFGLGTTSVSWHSDSSLQDCSTVAVYHTYENTERRDWRVALRALDAECPPLVVALEDRATYYMAGDFNDTHHHAVLTGSSARFSSTHRVGVVAKDTFKYIQKRCLAALDLVPGLERDAFVDCKKVQFLADVHREVEFQWIRMFYLQGAEHARFHEKYWTKRIAELIEAWDRMELCFRRILARLKNGEAQSIRAYAIMLYVLKTIKELRDEHTKRVGAPAYALLPEMHRPVDLPVYDDTSPLPFDLRPAIRFLEQRQRIAEKSV